MKRKTYTVSFTLPDLAALPATRQARYALPVGMMTGGLGLGLWSLQQLPTFPTEQVAAGSIALTGLLGITNLALWWRQRRRRLSLKPATIPGGGPVYAYDTFANQTTARLARLIIEHGVHCNAEPVRGPFTLTYRLALTKDLASGLRTIRSLQPALQQALRAPVRLQESPQGILVEVQLPESLCWTPNAAKLARVARWNRLPLGVDQFARPVWIDPAEHGVMAWIAPPRRGKTASIRASLYLMKQAEPTLQFFVCAMPAKLEADWGNFGLAQGCLGLVSDFQEMADSLAWAVRMMQTRALDSRLAIVVDDLTNLTAHVPSIGEHIDELATAGAGLGVHLMLGTHTSGSKQAMAGMRTMASATCRVLFKAADSSQASRSAGQKNSETGLGQLSGFKGDGLLLENGVPTRIATAFVSDADVLTLPTSTGQHARPWRSQLSQRSQPTCDHAVIARDRSQPRDRAVIVSTSEDHSHDHGSQRSQPLATPHASGHAAVTRGGAPDHGVTVIGRDRDQLSAKEQRERLLSSLPDCFPIQPARPLTSEEDELVRYLYDSGLFSESALADVVYKQRNPKRVGWVRESLARSAPGETTDDKEMTEAMALAILDGGDIDHPRRTEALLYLSENVRINGKGWEERGPRKAYE